MNRPIAYLGHRDGSYVEIAPNFSEACDVCETAPDPDKFIIRYTQSDGVTECSCQAESCLSEFYGEPDDAELKIVLAIIAGAES